MPSDCCLLIRCLKTLYADLFLPLFQVSLFCLAIGQDPKELPVAIVNSELRGAQACQPSSFSSECPLTMGLLGPEPNEHLRNLTCRYLSYLDLDIGESVSYICPCYFCIIISSNDTVSCPACMLRVLKGMGTFTGEK